MNVMIYARLLQGWKPYCTHTLRLALAAGFLLAGINGYSMPTVTSLDNANNGKAGYVDGPTFTAAQFHTPMGIAIDDVLDCLYVADRDNNAVRMLDLVEGETYTFLPNTNTFVTASMINKPVGVQVDSDGNVFVLNRGSSSLFSTNGTILEFDYLSNLIATNATKLTNAAGLALDASDNIYVTVRSNSVIQITPGGVVSTIATITNAGTSLQGIIVKHNGLLAVADSGRNGIYLINPATGQVSTNTGFNGAGDYTGVNNRGATGVTIKYNEPSGLAEAGDGSLIVTDTGNNRVKVITPTGLVTNLYGVASNYWTTAYPGWKDGTVQVPDSALPNVQARLPVGIAFGSDGTVYTTEDYYHLIRKVTGSGLPLPPPPIPGIPTIYSVTTNFGQVTLTWSAVSGATSYNVKRSSTNSAFSTIANTTGTSYTDTNIFGGATYYYIVSALNSGGESPNSATVRATVPVPPPPTPTIGWFDYEGSPNPVTVLHPVNGTPYITHNDLMLAINPNAGGVNTKYTTDGSLPSATNGSTPPFYQDGLTNATPLTATMAPSLTIEAVSINAGGSSGFASAQFNFQAANPSIVGNNAAQFTISDITANANLYYTLDGSDPSSTNANAVNLGTVATPTNVWSVGLAITTNTLFKVRAFRANYQPSDIVSITFSVTNYLANTISFGFASGEASSDFVAAPGETFYAPVTLSVLSSAIIYSLQFNLTVTNAGINPGPPIAPGAYNFASMLEKPLPGSAPQTYVKIPPYMFIGDAVGPVPPGQIITYEGTNFVDLEISNTNINLLGVGWLERAGVGETNLYDTRAQDLIQYSQAHDTLFLQGGGQIIVGGYAFQVPSTAQPGQTYQIQIGRPSATSDGVGAPGSLVYIATPTNGSLVGGTINSIKVVTTGQRKYLVGDAYPFRWFNAGDFGNSNLENADVEQVFQSAVYNWNDPPYGSDFADSMDSCGYTYIDNGNGYLEKNTFADPTVLFDGNDTTINQIAFGDGQLDVADVYVTYRRSLDPSLTWFRRFWTNGVLAAEIVPNVVPQALHKSPAIVSKVNPNATSTNAPQVNFSASDFVASAGQTIQVPITAQIFGAYPLRVLMLNLTVVPLDGSPAITTAVSFTPNPALGTPTITDSMSAGNYAATWLDSTIAGLTGTVTLGTLTVTVPPTATKSSAYAVHFDHASASPNGLASFPKQTLTGLITLSNRTNSSFGDGIPDSWRLRWFGTVNNLLSVSNACPSGDGINNFKKYVAGVDPNTANNFPTTRPVKPAPPGSNMAIHWPTVSGKQYVIERSNSVFSGNWAAISTNTGTGTDLEFDDNSTSTVNFYRVRILP